MGDAGYWISDTGFQSSLFQSFGPAYRILIFLDLTPDKFRYIQHPLSNIVPIKSTILLLFNVKS